MESRLERLRRRLGARLRALVRGEELDREHDEEVRLHLELEAADLARRHGLTAQEARRRALVGFGGVTQTREAHREARGVSALESLGRDAHYALRALWRAPAFSLSAVAVLALGIGAGTAVFSAVRAVLLAPLPYPAPDELVEVHLQSGPNRLGLSDVDALSIAARSRTLAAFGVVRRNEMALSYGREPERIPVGLATAGFFMALGVRPAAGRLLAPADADPAAPPVVVIGHALAQRAFGSDAAALGRAITVDGAPRTVVGVLPAGVHELAGYYAEVWPALRVPVPTRRGPFGMLAVGRLAEGVPLAAGRRELAAISVQVYREWRASFQDSTARLTPEPLRAELDGKAASALGLLAAAVALVLLTAMANVASLTLVRALTRRREVTLRATLGATRRRLARLLLTESVLVALAGAILGLVLGAGGLRVLAAIGANIPRLEQARLDLAAVAFAVVLALVVGVLVGAYPVIYLLRGDASVALGAGARAAGLGRGTRALRTAFVIAQFALALPLLAGAGLLLRSVLRLQAVDPGLDPAHLLAVRVALPSARYPDDASLRAFWTRAVLAVRGVPGVIGAGLNSAIPPDDPDVCCNNFDLVDHPVAPGGAQPISPWMFASPEYFSTVGARLDEGRLLTPADTGAAPVIVVSRTWARRYFPEGRVIGRQLVSGGCTSCPLTTVVGVVSDIRYAGLESRGEDVYSPVAEAWLPRSLFVFARTAGPPAGELASVRAALRSLDPEIPLDDAATMQQRLARSTTQPREIAGVVGGFAAVALLLAAVGVFGMLSYVVGARRRELGVRMALGAPPRDVVRMVARDGVGLALAGAAIGLVLTALAADRLAGVLFEVEPRDPLTLLAVTTLLLTAALLASWLPARAAARIEPVEAIRAE